MEDLDPAALLHFIVTLHLDPHYTLCYVEERSEDASSNHIYIFLGGVSP
jgi:hypothetical protein